VEWILAQPGLLHAGELLWDKRTNSFFLVIKRKVARSGKVLFPLFVKNLGSESRRYFNGVIGTTSINDNDFVAEIFD
jgi:hypothetical protein